MKAFIHPDGTVELEIHNGDGQAALDLIRSLQGGREAEATPIPTLWSNRPRKREAWESASLAVVRLDRDPDTALINGQGEPVAYVDIEALSPAEQTAYDALLALGATTPEKSVHVNKLAKHMKMGRGVVNARCVAATNRGWLTRHTKGAYWVSARDYADLEDQ